MNTLPNGPKPGWQTTEFATTVLSNLVAILLTVHAISQTQADSLQGWVPMIAGAIIFVVVNTSYTRSRTQVKEPWEQALAALVGLTTVPQTAPVAPATLSSNQQANAVMGMASPPLSPDPNATTASAI